MDAKDVMEAASCWPGELVVNHLEALDHCPVKREKCEISLKMGVSLIEYGCLKMGSVVATKSVLPPLTSKGTS
jgi:hypothetical protein